MANVTDDSYLRKLLILKRPVKFIAAKLGISEPEAVRRIENLKRMAQEQEHNGASELLQLEAVMANQHQLLGYSLGLYQAAFQNRPEVTELNKIIESCPAGTDLAVHLLKHLIILRPFSLPTPARAMQALESPSGG